MEVMNEANNKRQRNESSIENENNKNEINLKI